jgi:hypothetical protein
MKLTNIRTVTTTFAMTAIAAVALAASAQADPALLNGNYASIGGAEGFVWTIATNCAPNGCTGSVASNQGWNVPTTFDGSTWNFTVTKPDGVICDDGSYAPAYISLSVDPGTLNGAVSTDSNGECPGGQITRAPFQIRKVG